jgi:hypothetical protein
MSENLSRSDDPHVGRGRRLPVRAGQTYCDEWCASTTSSASLSKRTGGRHEEALC